MLSEVPGVQVLPDGPRGQFTRVFLRGAASNQTLVLVDGVPQNDATTGGGYDFNDLGTAGVERIDVLGGSYGVLYGSEAIGGVVAVTTRRGLGPWRGSVRFEGGSFATHREVFAGGGGDDEFDLWFTAANEASGGERKHEDFESQTVATRIGFRVTESLRADLSLRGNHSDVEVPFDFPAFGSTILPEDPNIERDRSTVSTALNLTHQVRDFLTTRFTVSWLQVDSSFENGTDGPELIDPDFTPGTGDEITVVRYELDSDNTAQDLRFRLAPTLQLARLLGWRRREDGGVEIDVTAGGEFLDQRSESDTSFPNFGAPGYSASTIHRDIDTTSFFALAEARFPDLGPVRGGVFSVGARNDDNDAFGDETSPFVGARCEVGPVDTLLRSSWGEGFRAPKPSELDDPTAGNPDLGPETSESFDVGVLQPLVGGRVEVGATWFRLDTDDLIAFDPAATSPSRPFGQLVNFNRTRTDGWEFEARADLGAGFTVRGNYTDLDPRDRDTDAFLPNRSERFGGAGVSWERGAWLLSLDALWSSKFPDQGGEYTYPEPDEREAPGRRALVNLTARWQVNRHVTVFGRIENLLDDDWVATPTSPAGTPLGVFAGLQLDW
jgi:vitamin B12 transporter